MFSSSNLKLLPQHTKTLKDQGLFRQDGRKVFVSETKQHLISNDLYHQQHFSCDSPIRFMLYWERTETFISLHADNTVYLYKADEDRQTLTTQLPFKGLTVTKIPGCLVGWGPGPVFTLLDCELRPLEAAVDALDIRMCEIAEHSLDVVTAGVGNVCVWSVIIMECKVKIQDGLPQDDTLTHMTLAPPGPDKPHRAFVANGHVVIVVDLDGGRVLEHKKDLCSSDITAMAFSSHLNCLIIASKNLLINIWGPDWTQHMTFLGHDDVVTSLFFCSKLNMLISTSLDCTIRTWDAMESGMVKHLNIKLKNPLLYVGGTRKGDTFFSFSEQGVDFFTIRALCTLHCQFPKNESASLRQILISNCPPPYPTQILCVSSDNLSLVAAETGLVLTSFKAEDRILCADYCPHKEILLALTEAGTVIKANTLTTPSTLMQVWKDIGQGPWQHTELTTIKDAGNLPVPGPACCLVVYSWVVDPQGALEGWRSLQEQRGCSDRSDGDLHDPKNKFLVIIGQSGGCVSLLTLNNGKVFFRTPAHNNQKVTALQAYPENNCLLSTGEDLTVVLWKVDPFNQQHLTQHLSIDCGQTQVYLALLGPQLALTFGKPNGPNILKFFNLLNQNQTDHLSGERHSNQFTGLCAIPELKMFISSSLDKTMCIWNEEHHLIRTVQFQAVPQCLACSRYGGDVFLVIKGDLYIMKTTQFLPEYNPNMIRLTSHGQSRFYLPILRREVAFDQIQTSKYGAEKLLDITSYKIMSKYLLQDKDRLMILNMDLKALLKGHKIQKKEKREKKVKLPSKEVVSEDNDFDDSCLNSGTKYIATRFIKKEQDIHLKFKQDIPVKQQRRKIPLTIRKITPDREEESLEPPEIIIRVDKLKPKTAPPATSQQKPSPEVPPFLRQFAEMNWFLDLYPDRKNIPSNLSPDDFALKLLNYLQNCSIATMIQILAALLALHSQGLLQNTDELYTGLINFLPTFIKPQVSPLDGSVIVDTLNLLVRLKSEISYELVKIILILLAYKELALRKPLFHLLGTLGVEEAEEWLWPELSGWDVKLEDESSIRKKLQDRADCWLEFWITKLKEHNRYLYLMSTAKWKPTTFGAVDILNYFCFVQKEEHRKVKHVVPGRKNTVLLPLRGSSRPILRLGETYTMARIRSLPDLILPPLQKRPFLMHFPSFIILPLPRVAPDLFHPDSDENPETALMHRYFIPQQSLVQYYRQ